MRIPRNRQLAANDTTHTIWRGHNGDPIFKDDNKRFYLELLAKEVEDSDVDIHSYCIMNNHNHVVNTIDTVNGYSRLFKDVHGPFAQRYNKRENRRGAVGMGRPKSLVIQNEEYLINVMFYVDANPVRARMVKHPSDYRWGSYNYYAFGRRDPSQPALKPPDWYQRLGNTPADRQRAYRRLFDAYMRREGLIPKHGMSSGYYVGDLTWVEVRRQRHRRHSPTDAVLHRPESSDTS